jgi:pyrimidine 5'-nucleotidase
MNPDAPHRDFAQVESWIFDLDNTLYPPRSNLFAQVDRRMGEFISQLLSVDRIEAKRIQKAYYRDYGTTLRGLMSEHGVDPHDFLAYVHDIDHSPIAADPALGGALSLLPGRKFVLTNGSRAHAEAVLARLGIAEHFEDLFATPQGVGFAALARLHELGYASVETASDLAPALHDATAAGGVHVVEVRTDRAANVKLHARLCERGILLHGWQVVVWLLWVADPRRRGKLDVKSPELCGWAVNEAQPDGLGEQVDEGHRGQDHDQDAADLVPVIDADAVGQLQADAARPHKADHR